MRFQIFSDLRDAALHQIVWRRAKNTFNICNLAKNEGGVVERRHSERDVDPFRDQVKQVVG